MYKVTICIQHLNTDVFSNCNHHSSFNVDDESSFLTQALEPYLMKKPFSPCCCLYFKPFFKLFHSVRYLYVKSASMSTFRLLSIFFLFLNTVRTISGDLRVRCRKGCQFLVPFSNSEDAHLVNSQA